MILIICIFIYIYHYYIYCFLHQLNQSLKCSLWSFYGLAESSDREVTGSIFIFFFFFFLNCQFNNDNIIKNLPSEVKSLSKPSNHYSPVTLGLYGVGNY